MPFPDDYSDRNNPFERAEEPETLAEFQERIEPVLLEKLTSIFVDEYGNRPAHEIADAIIELIDGSNVLANAEERAEAVIEAKRQAAE